MILSTEVAFLGWSDEPGDVTPPSYNSVRAEPAELEDRRIQLSAMFTFEVFGKDTATYYLKARAGTGDNSAFDYAFHGLVCIYYPVRYSATLSSRNQTDATEGEQELQ